MKKTAFGQANEATLLLNVSASRLLVLHAASSPFTAEAASTLLSLSLLSLQIPLPSQNREFRGNYSLSTADDTIDGPEFREQFRCLCNKKKDSAVTLNSSVSLVHHELIVFRENARQAQ